MKGGEVEEQTGESCVQGGGRAEGGQRQADRRACAAAREGEVELDSDGGED